jgi:unsaturated rhamnogalacturonyl hydrolase
MRNVKVGRVADSVLQINFLYEEGANGPYQPAAQNIVMENITVDHTPRVLNLTSFPAAKISGIEIRDCTFKQIEKPDVVKNADAKLVNCALEKLYGP